MTYPRYWLTPAFDLVMHLDVDQCTRGMPDVALLVASGGTVAITLHHGPVPQGRRMVEVSAEETIALARQKACARYRTRPRSSIAENRAADVTWMTPAPVKPAA